MNKAKSAVGSFGHRCARPGSWQFRGTAFTSLFTCICLVLMLLNSLQLFGQPNTYSVNQVVERIKSHNLELKGHALRNHLADAKYRAAKEWWVPDAQLGLNLHQLNGAAMNTDGRIFTDLDRQFFWGGINADAQWNLNDAVNGTKSAELRKDAVQHHTADARNKLICDAVLAFYALQNEQLKVVALEQLVSKSEDIAAQLDAAAAGGIAYRSDYLAAAAIAKEHALKLEMAKLERNHTAEQLRHVMLIESDVEIVEVDTAFGFSANDLIPATVGQQFRDHPALKSAQSQVTASESAKNYATRGLALPAVEIDFTAGGFGDVFSATGVDNEPIDALYPTTSILGALVWRIPVANLFGGGSAGIKSAQLEIDRNTLSQREQMLSSELKLSGQRLNFSRDVYHLSQESRDLARQAFDQSLARQEARLAAPFEVFQAQQRFVEAQMRWIEARKNVQHAVIEYRYAVGATF